MTSGKTTAPAEGAAWTAPENRFRYLLAGVP